MIVLGSLTLTDGIALLPVGIGCLVGAGVLAAIGRGSRRRRAARSPAPRPPREPRADEGDDESFANRRNSVRREGRAVKVFARSQSLKAVEAGYVLDRSTGGLRLALGLPVPAGAAVELRAKNAPDSTPWVTVIVRSCRNAGKHHELGCEFDSTPPWNVLLLFG